MNGQGMGIRLWIGGFHKAAQMWAVKTAAAFFKNSFYNSLSRTPYSEAASCLGRQQLVY